MVVSRQLAAAAVRPGDILTDQTISRGGPVQSRRQIGLWLFVVCALLVAMVLLGGYTRLTQSGLSMTDWRPVTGLLPPIGEDAWRAEFERYRQFPEFHKLHSWMEVADFKRIYVVEYAHRMLGRLIGIAFLIPFLYFLIRKRIPPDLTPKLVIMFVLGGLQGALGWYMVASGLVDKPDVSHLRLTAHLGFAVAIYGYILWIAIGLVSRPRGRGDAGLAALATALAALIFLQILSGGLVAGLDAGFAYNTWPLMDGALVPAGLFAAGPWLANFIDNITLVQFNHRALAYLAVALAVVLWWRARGRPISPPARRGVQILAALVLFQVMLGIATLLSVVPVALGVAHQGGALAVFTAAVFAAHRLRTTEGIGR